MRSRSADLLPSILLTVLSMIQALALELLWSRLHESAWLWSPGWDAVLGWTQLAAMLAGLLQVWLFYVSLALRFRWRPAIHDAVVPFGVGLLEFALIDLLGPEHLPLWFYLLAFVFGLSTWASHSMFSRARQDPANREFFATVARATPRDFAVPAAAIAGLLLLGAALELTDDRSWLALGALLVAFAALAYQVELTRRYWNYSPAELGPPDAAS